MKFPIRFSRFYSKAVAFGSASFLLLYGATGYADDTEIFFAQASGNARPNVLFIIDDSGSMSSGGGRWGESHPNNRMGIIQSAVTQVIKDSNDINIGLFNMYDQSNSASNGYLNYANTVPLVAVQDISVIRQTAINALNSLKPRGVPNIEPQTIYHAARYYSARPFHNNSGPASPIVSECQANYLVYVTDGQGNDLTPQMVQTITGSSSCSGFSHHGQRQCASTVVDWLLKNDQNPSLPGKQNIVTHTMGTFGASVQHLKNVASAGGGNYYDAGSTSAGIINAFNSIIQDAITENSVSFTNASVSINSANQQDDEDVLYYGLFKPEKTERWAGNLKSYFLDINPATKSSTVRSSTAADTPGEAALKADGEFSDTARSRWSTANDGANIMAGGAALRLPHPADRKLLVQMGNSLQALNVGNQNITTSKLGVADINARKEAINYIRGFEKDGVTVRKFLGDPLHSAPTLVNYRCGNISAGKCAISANEKMVIIGTNEGFVHMFDAKTGVEKFAFMPELLLPNIKKLQENKTMQNPSSGIHPYGMDNTVAVWMNDVNNNGVIYGAPGSAGGLNSGEFVYAYATMRRGGRGLYALNITDPSSPSMLWHIVGGETSGFERLGQTWSKPVKTKVKVAGQEIDVLIIGGGYDAGKNDNNATYRSSSQLGNAIYIINAKTGQKIWSASATGADLVLPKMQYSIPGDVRVLERNGLAEQIFVGDTGGQVWRLLIRNGNPQNTLVEASTPDNGPFADLGGAGGDNARRFYHEPDVSFTTRGGSRLLTVNIGSGYRAHPLNNTVKDRIYSLHSTELVGSVKQPTVTENDLYDATVNVLDGSEAMATAALSGKKGWYMILSSGAGEKMISTPEIANGVILFNTYVPSVDGGTGSACSPAQGRNHSYPLRLHDATPASVPVGTISTSYSDRYTVSKNKGISSSFISVCKGDTCYYISSLADADRPTAIPRSVINKNAEKMYWFDTD